ncbi:MAG TPA: PIG-L deacetylase family protein [Actinomycetota bacterium]
MTMKGIEVSTALVVAAHPDDVEFGAGGTIARLAAEGAEVTICIVSNGAMGSNDPGVARDVLIATREREQRAAAAAAGAAGVVFLGYEDGYLEDSHEIRRDIIREIRRLRPDIAIGPDPSTFFIDQRYLNHPDHRAVGLAFSAAINPGATTVPLYRPELYDQGFGPHPLKAVLLMAATNPDYYVDISAHMGTKIKALQAHVSQLGAYEGLGDRVREMAKLTAEQGGTGAEYAEAFKGFFFEQRPSAQGEVKA